MFFFLTTFLVSRTVNSSRYIYVYIYILHRKYKNSIEIDRMSKAIDNKDNQEGEEGGIWIWDGSQKSERPCFLLPDGGGTLNHGDGCDSRSRRGERIEDGVRSSWLLSLCLLGPPLSPAVATPFLRFFPPRRSKKQKISLLNFFHNFPSWFKWITTFFSTTRDFGYEFGIVGYSIEDDEEAREESERGGKKGRGERKKKNDWIFSQDFSPRRRLSLAPPFSLLSFKGRSNWFF